MKSYLRRVFLILGILKNAYVERITYAFYRAGVRHARPSRFDTYAPAIIADNVSLLPETPTERLRRELTEAIGRTQQPGMSGYTSMDDLETLRDRYKRDPRGF